MPRAAGQFSHDNVYGNALRLLEEHRVSIGDDGREVIHLDVSCGDAPLADPLVAALGRSYVGTDSSPDVIARLRERGYEAHQLELLDREQTAAGLREAIGDRRLASISLIDVVQGMPPTQTALAGIRDVALEHGATVVVSAPNITHTDVAFKLLTGRWDVTGTGVLSVGALQHFDAAAFERMLRIAGLHPTASYDVSRERSDQHFPVDHSALQRGTSLHGLLLALREEARPGAQTTQFVRMCIPGPLADEPAFVETRDVDRPFLSVVMRTQGTRLQCLVEALTCLAGQTDTDFEVLVVGHRLTFEAQVGVESVIGDLPDWLRERTQLIRVEHGRRATPLNVGFTKARGHYVAILDDDDIPLGHWVETFRDLAERHPGQMLRAVSARQDIVECNVLDRSAIRSTGPIEDVYPATFEFVDHLRQNFTPNTAIAFPRGIVHDMGIRFDESLTTTEDWDFIMRAACVVGVASAPRITSLYHWWTQGASSRTDHDNGEWDRNLQAILRKFDENPVLMPVGATSRIRALLRERDEALFQVLLGRGDVEALEGKLERERERVSLLFEVQDILDSRSWRVSAPLRIPGRLVGRGRGIKASHYEHYSTEQLNAVISGLRSSRSWRATRRLRRRA
jgi:glycosyltransferase involved in cell wall biosynthesis